MKQQPRPDDLPDADGIVWRHAHVMRPATHGLWRLVPKRLRPMRQHCDHSHQLGFRHTRDEHGMVTEVFMRHVDVDWAAMEAQVRKAGLPSWLKP